MKNTICQVSLKKNIKNLRSFVGLTLPELSQACKINLNSLNQYEYGKILPPIENLLKLSNYFDVTIDFLLQGANNQFINYSGIFNRAEKINKLPLMHRNHIESSLAEFVTINENRSSFDNIAKYKLTKNINNNFKTVREVNSLTQIQLAKELGLKAQSYISKYESNTIPPYDIIECLSKMFFVSVQYLLTGNPIEFQVTDETFLKSLLSFDKAATLEDMRTIKNLMQQILKNNNISIAKF